MITHIMELVTALITVTVLVTARSEPMADWALSALGMRMVYQIYLRTGSNTQLKARPATAAIMDHLTI